MQLILKKSSSQATAQPFLMICKKTKNKICTYHQDLLKIVSVIALFTIFILSSTTMTLSPYSMVYAGVDNFTVAFKTSELLIEEIIS